jgi:thioredoxin 1
MVAYITELNNNNFKSFTENEFSLVDVYAPWCGPCKMISPIVDEISSTYQGRLSVGKLNADDNREIISEFGVRNIPTLLFFKNGELLRDDSNEVVKLVGNISKAKLEETINSFL